MCIYICTYIYIYMCMYIHILFPYRAKENSKLVLVVWSAQHLQKPVKFNFAWPKLPAICSSLQLSFWPLKPCGKRANMHPRSTWKPAHANTRLQGKLKHGVYLKASQKRTGRGGQREAFTMNLPVNQIAAVWLPHVSWIWDQSDAIPCPLQ